MNLSEFLHMGGYGAYVWPCYLLTAAVLIGMEWISQRRLKAAQLLAGRRAQAAGSQA